MSKKLPDLTGHRCGRLVVLEKSHSSPSGTYWKCICDCGETRFYTRQNLTDGRMKSCGCFKSECKGNSHKGWRGKGKLAASFVSKIKSHAKRRKVPFSLDKNYLWSLFEAQHEQCALTGLVLTFPNTNKELTHGSGSASLDRIDSNNGYVPGNVQWVHKDINMMKQQFSTKHFVEMCKLVSKHL